MNNLECKCCGSMLPESEFKPDDRYKRGFTSWCASCHKEKNREWYLKNKKRHNKKSRRWRRNNLDAARKISRKYHTANVEVRSAANADWSSRNKDKRRATTAKRKAAKLQATPKWVDWTKVNAVYRDAKRIQEHTGIPHHVDHIVPLQGETVCGLHWERNLQVIPAADNVRKRNKWDERIEKAYAQPDMFVEPPAKLKQESLL